MAKRFELETLMGAEVQVEEKTAKKQPARRELPDHDDFTSRDYSETYGLHVGVNPSASDICVECASHTAYFPRQGRNSLHWACEFAFTKLVEHCEAVRATQGYEAKATVAQHGRVIRELVCYVDEKGNPNISTNVVEAEEKKTEAPKPGPVSGPVEMVPDEAPAQEPEIVMGPVREASVESAEQSDALTDVGATVMATAAIVGAAAMVGWLTPVAFGAGVILGICRGFGQGRRR